MRVLNLKLAISSSDYPLRASLFSFFKFTLFLFKFFTVGRFILLI